LQGGEEAALFVCPVCGRAHEPREDGLESFFPLTAAITTELALAGPVQYLAAWRLDVTVSNVEASAWERIRRVTAPETAYLYVPAFSLVRPVVQRLGVSLTEAQPVLELSSGLAAGAAMRPALVDAGADVGVRTDVEQAARGATGRGADAGEGEEADKGPDFGTFSPILAGRKDARMLAHFVYLAVESHEAHDLQSVDYELETVGEELVFIPAVWDPRCIHESNWRLLLREFDGLVA